MWRVHLRISSRRQLRRLPNSMLRDAFPIDPNRKYRTEPIQAVQDPEKQPSLKTSLSSKQTRGRCCSLGLVCYVCLGKLCSVHSLAMPWWSLMPPWHASLSEDFCRRTLWCKGCSIAEQALLQKLPFVLDRFVFNLFNLNQLILLELDVVVTGLSSSQPLGQTARL